VAKNTVFPSLLGAFQGRRALHRNLHILNKYILRRQDRAPYLASHKLTYRCNLRCAQCPYYKMQAPDPTFSEVTKTLDDLYTQGIRIVIFEGGEPMLWHDGDHTIADVVKAARGKFDCVGMTTNGTLSLDVPTDVLWVSIDGFADTHNRLRDGQIFDRIMENIATSQHPRLFAHITINTVNAPEVPDLVRFLSERVKGITVQFYYPYNHEYALYLDHPARGELIAILRDLKDQGFPLLNSHTSLQNMDRGGWRCDDWLIANANPDGSITQGCYVKGRDDIDCDKCGFTPHTEIAMAYQGKLDAVRAGIEIFFAN
jgi:MoaA/NifB/PqqE/SkfB family radical SAM enzyme